MTKLAIVGSRDLVGNDEAWSAVVRSICKYRPTQIISGGAGGVDTMAFQAARQFDIDFTLFLPTNAQWEPDGYKQRNMEIAEACDYLVCIVSDKCKTYGSGWTRDYAKKIGKPTEEIVIEIQEE